MPVFDYSECISNNDKDNDCSGLYIDEDNYIQLLIARCAIGSVEITHLTRGKSYPLSKNFISQFYTSSETDPLKQIIDLVSSALSASDIKNYYSIVSNRNRNDKFYNSLLIEYSHFCMHYECGNHTAAFVYVYRILELISYPFPLLYASQTNDFKHTYSFLKDYFSENKGNRKGELGFYKSFIAKTFNSNPIASTSIDFDLSLVANFDHRKRLFNKVKQICPDSVLHADTSPYDKIAVNFTEMSSFIITLRNRFFHQFNRGDANFEDDEVYDSDEVFQIFNEGCFGWLSVVYLQILKVTWSAI
ncbi:MAG: hypothetical protein RhofKO_11830 [Rhodothermales bacterium]